MSHTITMSPGTALTPTFSPPYNGDTLTLSPPSPPPPQNPNLINFSTLDSPGLTALKQDFEAAFWAKINEIVTQYVSNKEEFDEEEKYRIAQIRTIYGKPRVGIERAYPYPDPVRDPVFGFLESSIFLDWIDNLDGIESRYDDQLRKRPLCCLRHAGQKNWSCCADYQKLLGQEKRVEVVEALGKMEKYLDRLLWEEGRE